MPNDRVLLTCRLSFPNKTCTINYVFMALAEFSHHKSREILKFNQPIKKYFQLVYFIC